MDISKNQWRSTGGKNDTLEKNSPHCVKGFHVKIWSLAAVKIYICVTQSDLIGPNRHK